MMDTDMGQKICSCIMMDTDMTQKVCSGCKELKPLSEFYIRRDRNKHQAYCKKCQLGYQKEWRKRNIGKGHKYHRDYMRNYRIKIRKKVLARFGTICKKCDFKDWRSLQVDHIHGGGMKDKAKFRSRTYRYYKYLLELPDEELHVKYQCLCANCNAIKIYENEERYKHEGVTI